MNGFQLPGQPFAVRYTSAAGIACLLYDHLLTFEAERQAIWANKNTNVLSKFGFFANRYGSEALGLYVAYVLSSAQELNLSKCITFVWIFSIIVPIFVTISHFAVMFRIHHIWDRRRTIGYILTASFLFVISLLCVLAVFAALQTQPYILYIAPLRSCYVSIKPWEFPAALGVISLFDFFLIILTIFNSLDVPRRHDIEIVGSLKNDAAKAFLLLFILRLANMVMSIIGDTTDAFVLLPIVWLLCAVINSRLQIRLESLSRPGHGPTHYATPVVEMPMLPVINPSAGSGLLIPWKNYSRTNLSKIDSKD